MFVLFAWEFVVFVLLLLLQLLCPSPKLFPNPNPSGDDKDLSDLRENNVLDDVVEICDCDEGYIVL